ncbi:macrophage mannose receptor 1-like [Plectropomus leopardus]|uniref:macrophage mannose receptor 1-like n=1 Tax=Plectropomus leopardus TaxID=160734 RepID=UPI001C4B180D|nr:macrophage mannose receptor 1-like [Plectropomus leopardus]
MAKMQWSLFVLILMGQSSFLTCHHYEYHFVKENKTWTEAQKYCRDNYTDLATVFDMTDTKRLRDLAQNQDAAWIGLYSDPELNNKKMWRWQWSLPELEFSTSEENWYPQEPQDALISEACVPMDRNHKWKDVPCTTEFIFEFICYDERNQSDQKFHFIKNEVTWSKAQNYCREHHTDLVSGREQLDKISEDIDNKIGGKNVWIGLFRDSWRWSDESSFSFRNWNRQLFKSEDGNKKCAMTMTDGKWTSDECKKTKPFFCYDDKVILIKEKKTWDGALDYCRKNHSDLVSITNPHQQRWVQERAKKANTSYVWMGLRYTCFMDLWFWVNDCVVCYDNWAPGGRQEGCDRAAAMDIEGKWFKMTESDTFNFICTLK